MPVKRAEFNAWNKNDLFPDLYGPKYVQAIHGRFLLAATASSLIGPTLLLSLRKMSENAAIQGLLFDFFFCKLLE